MKYVFGLLLVAALAGGLWWQSQAPAKPQGMSAPVVSVSVYTVEAREFSDRVEALGSLRGNESVTITANASDTIEAIHFEEGQQVTKGQLLVTLEQAEEQAQLAAAKADLAEQQREVRRLEGLVKTLSAAQTELDTRRTALQKARYKIDELEARIADRRITAPFAGVLGLRLVSPGALLTPGTAITTLDDINPMKLEFSVPAALLGTLNTGLELRAKTASYDEPFSGKVTVVDSRVNTTDRSIRARAEFDNSAGRLKPGMLMTIELLRNPRKALLIPEAAIVTREKQHSVWVVADDNTLQRRNLQIGSRQPGWVEVISGITAGETLVRANFPRLREGLKVTAPELEAEVEQTNTSAAS